MLINGETLKARETLTADVCIVGAGAAGLTLAQAFDAASFSVLLLESGSFRTDSVTQTLADGTTEGESYPFTEARARCFGGSTTRWSGVCIPLDRSDFQRREWMPYSGWAFELSHLEPYYQQAQTILGLSEDIPQALKTSPFHVPPLETKIMQFSRPLDLGRKYKQQIIQSRNITLVTHANVSQLIPDAEGKRIERLKVQGLSGNKFEVESRTVILATGGIENARLLLASNTHYPEGLGNSYDLVGRFFMEHYFKVVGILPLHQRQQDARFFTNLSPLGQTYTQGTFGLTDDLRHQQQLFNLHIRFYRYNLLEDTKAVIAAKQLQKSLRDDRNLNLIPSQLKQLLHDHSFVLPRYFFWHFWNKLNPSAYFDHVRLLASVEQEPDPNNRITLSSKLDYLGQPQAHLTLNFSKKMWQSVDRSLEYINKTLLERGFERLQYDAARLKHLTPYNKIGLHHMGTTRMHHDPRHGVVDSNCKVHNLANLYIAGSSVFPTGGSANPTFTIVALALRLANHIHRIYS
ncbi:hypothetical protein C7H19_07445 [Aphanothece hegewaldii CCALA 016]|uniref:Glucose-methanol-choline oxidoreductase C-terminal domain-containing protein n=1 Tax=Aphanothece hegewaldii CCALA 016 TaxID=2107694 RepID=A0A2T1LZH3_9CHRO|nr:GMC family oxidoreductase [Aphanothece hegewaldii]PSF37811.1 hypothetical protein C7H19_07445 [Aphanothece hegewaldii CCALA 016]